MSNEEFHTCNAPIAALWKRRSVLKSCAISLTSRWKGSFLMSNSVDFWYRRISRRATVPGLQKDITLITHPLIVVIVSFIQSLYLYLCGFFTPPVDGALFRAALVANCFLGAFPPVDLRAVCLVRAILSFWKRGQIYYIPGIHTLMEFYSIDQVTHGKY